MFKFFWGNFVFFHQWILVTPEQKVGQIQNNMNQNALQEIATLFVTIYKLQKFHQISKFPNQNAFQTILSNFDFFYPRHPLPPTITRENEKTLDLAWHKLDLGKIFSPNFCSKFSSNFLEFFSSINEYWSHQNKKSSKFKIIWTKIDYRRLLFFVTTCKLQQEA